MRLLISLSALLVSFLSRILWFQNNRSVGWSWRRRASSESRLLLARASTPEQHSRIGTQTGGRVFLFLYTDDFWRDYNAYRTKGIVFVREPKEEPYATVAV